MSSLEIEERFSVSAPVARVWRHLLDPERMVVCLPGAELIEVADERTFHGQMKVKVGPIMVGYKGTIALTEVDEAGRRIRMEGKGKEQGGAGSAKMTMESHLTPVDGGCEVVVTADVQLAGRIARMGRGMIQSVARQLFEQFAGNVRRQIEEEGDSEEEAGAPAAAAPVHGEEEAGAPAAGEQAVPAEAEGPAAGEQAVPAEAEALRASEAAGRSGAVERSRPLAPRQAEAVRLLPLLLRALRDGIAGLFRKLLGRRAAR